MSAARYVFGSFRNSHNRKTDANAARASTAVTVYGNLSKIPPTAAKTINTIPATIGAQPTHWARFQSVPAIDSKDQARRAHSLMICILAV